MTRASSSEVFPPCATQECTCPPPLGRASFICGGIECFQGHCSLSAILAGTLGNLCCWWYLILWPLHQFKETAGYLILEKWQRSRPAKFSNRSHSTFGNFWVGKLFWRFESSSNWVILGWNFRFRCLLETATTAHDISLKQSLAGSMKWIHPLFDSILALSWLYQRVSTGWLCYCLSLFMSLYSSSCIVLCSFDVLNLSLFDYLGLRVTGGFFYFLFPYWVRGLLINDCGCRWNERVTCLL